MFRYFRYSLLSLGGFAVLMNADIIMVKRLFDPEIAGLFDEETEPHLGVIGAHQICHDDYDKQATPGAFGSRQWLIAPAIKPNDLAGLANVRADLVGPALDAFMRRAVRHAARVRRFKQDDIASKNRCRPDPAIAISYFFNSKHGPMIAIGVVYGVAPRALGVGERLVHQCLEIQGSTRQAGGPPSSL